MNGPTYTFPLLNVSIGHSMNHLIWDIAIVPSMNTPPFQRDYGGRSVALEARHVQSG